jgi:hypothetical protein
MGITITTRGSQKGEGRAWQDIVMPIHVARSAIDHHTPSRDLDLSPLHCVFFTRRTCMSRKKSEMRRGFGHGRFHVATGSRQALRIPIHARARRHDPQAGRCVGRRRREASTSLAFTGVLERPGIDNVFIERLWRSLKQEDMYLKVIPASRPGSPSTPAGDCTRRSCTRTPVAVGREGVTGALGAQAMDMRLRFDNAVALAGPQPQQQQQQTALIAA